MKQHIIRTLHTERMAIHAIKGGLTIIDDGFLVERSQVTLIKPHLMPLFITGRNQSISQVSINFLRSYMNTKRLINRPFTGLLLIYLNSNGIALRCFNHFLPVPFRKQEFAIFSLFHPFPITCRQYGDSFLYPLIDLKAQRSHIRRNGHPDIIRIDGWSFIHHMLSLGYRSRTSDQKEASSYIFQYISHHLRVCFS